jgi:hypothetical protein
MQAVIAYLEKELPNLSEQYHWRIPQIDGFDRSRETSYDANLELKRFLRRHWDDAKDGESKLAVARTVIADWGGVRGNTNATLNRYVLEAAKQNPDTPFSGVASYSKLFAIVNPDRFAIYDARVAACLNAVQILHDPDFGIAFNYCPGRNQIVGNVNNRQGFAFHPEFTVTGLANRGWSTLPRAETYARYLSLLSECRKALPKYRIHDFEMLFFANAERECQAAIRRAEGY